MKEEIKWKENKNVIAQTQVIEIDIQNQM